MHHVAAKRSTPTGHKCHQVMPRRPRLKTLLIYVSALMLALACALYLLATIATGQISSPTASPVLTGTVGAGNYAGPLRPQIHFSTPKGFMNDPNGLFIDASGTYHLYYQCEYPFALQKLLTLPANPLQITQLKR